MHSHLAKMLGLLLKETRHKKGITQKKLAQKIGVSAQFLGRVEHGEVMIPLSALKRSIKFLSLSEKKLIMIYRTAGTETARDLFHKMKK